MSRLQTASRFAQNDERQPDNGNDFEQLMQQPMSLDNSAIAAITRAEADIQITTAKKYPRSVHQSKALAMTMATISVDTAASCFYKLPRKQKKEDGSGYEKKYIEGPSVRLAEIFGSAWGNMKMGARIIEEDDRFVVAQGFAHDLQQNSSSSSEVRRRITGKYGRFNDDMIVVTANAACSIARRNAIFQVIPRCYVDEVLAHCKKVAIGDAKTLPQRRTELLGYLKNKMGLELERVLAAVEVAAEEDITLDDMETLHGLATAVRDGETSVDDAFPLPAKQQEQQEPPTNKAAALAQSITGSAQAKPQQPKSAPPTDAQPPAPEDPPVDQESPEHGDVQQELSQEPTGFEAFKIAQWELAEALGCTRDRFDQTLSRWVLGLKPPMKGKEDSIDKETLAKCSSALATKAGIWAFLK